jgi:hypothetical protein
MAFLRLHGEPGDPRPLASTSLVAADGTVRVPLGRRLLLGRGKHCDVVVESGRCAREDTVVEPTPDGWWAINLGNNQGMYVNGQKMVRRLLENGDELNLFACRFTFVSEPGDADFLRGLPGAAPEVPH